MSQTARLLTGSALTGSGQNPGWALTGSGQNPGRTLAGSGQNPGRALTGSGQKSRSAVDRVIDDASMTPASGNLNRFDRVENGSGQNRFDRVGHVTGSR